MLFFTASVFYANAQNVVIKNDQKEFVRQVHAILYERKGDLQRSRIRDFMPKLEKKWSKGRFTFEEKDKVISIADKVVRNGQLNTATFLEFFAALNGIASSSLSHGSIDCWLEYADRHCTDKNQKAFAEWLVTTQNLVGENRLYKSGNMQWKMRNAVYSFVGVDDFSVEVESCDLICASLNDSLVIHGTRGRFDGVSRWTGEGGETDWARFNDETLNDVFVKLDKYAVNLKKFECSADSVKLVNSKLANLEILGGFHDKVFAVPPSKKSIFPFFVSYKNDYRFDDVFRNIDFSGNIGMQGRYAAISGRDGKKAEVIFRDKDRNLVSVKSKKFILNEKGFSSDAVCMTIPFEDDSVYHAKLQMRYDDEKRELVMFRPANNSGCFWDSYHNMDISVDAMYWNIDEKQVAFSKLLSSEIDSQGYIKSANYFDKEEFFTLQGLDKNNPLILVSSYLEQYDEEKIELEYFCGFVKKTEQQAVNMMLRLEEFGYLDYDGDDKVAYPKELLYHTAKACRELTDYDIIKIKSVTKNRQPNLILNLDNFDFDVFGIDEVSVSRAKNVTIYPDSSKITIKKRFDFDFGGRLIAGLFEFNADEGNFLYDDFLVDFKRANSVFFFVKSREKNNLYEDRYVRVKNVLSDIPCTITLDDKDNKSGKKGNPNYPVFKSKQHSYIYFDEPYINDGLLDREKFYYIVEPFEIDSLLTYSTSEFAFYGVLHSAGLFPDISRPLVVEDDYSLGLDYDFGEDGTEAFNGRARYFNKVHISNRGFFGNGRIDFDDTRFSSSHFVFYLDSVVCTADKMAVEAKCGSPSRPSLSVDSAAVSWHFTNDKLFVKTLKTPARLYKNFNFDGLACLTSMGLTGDGLIDIEGLRIKSKYFNFASDSFVADTSDFSFVSDDREAVAASGFDIAMDIDRRKGVFSNVGRKSSMLKFPINAAESAANQVEWLMNDGVFKFETLALMSTNPLNQLTINCERADYNIAENIITAHSVKNVTKGNVIIVPKDGIVRMMENAAIDTLHGATLFSDSVNSDRPLTDLDVVINDDGLRGEGYCQYTDPFLMKHDIFLSEIRLGNDNAICGKGTVAQDEKLALDDNFTFYGDVFFRSDRNALRFNGLVEIPTDKFRGFGRFPINAEVMPENLVFPIDTASHSVFSGIVCGNEGLTVDFLSEKKPSNDENIIASYDGSVRFDRPLSLYIVENQEKQKNSKMVFNTQTNRFSGDIATDFGFGSRFLKFDADGTFDYSYSTDSLSFDVNIMFDFPINNELVDMIFDTVYKSLHPDVAEDVFFDDETEAEMLQTDDEDNETGDAAEKKQSKSGKSDKKQKNGGREKNERQSDMTRTHAVFNMKDVDIKYFRRLNTLIAVDSVHVFNIGRHKLDENLKLVMMANLNEPQSLKLYIEATPDIWFYFDYLGDKMSIVSNDDNFNEALDAVKRGQRVFDDKKNDEYFEYGPGDYYDVYDFFDLVNVIR